MLDYSLAPEQLAQLRAAYRRALDRRQADRIKAVVLLGTGCAAEQVAEALMVDANTVRSHFKCYRHGGIQALAEVAFRGSECWLSEFELALLDAHLQEQLYLSAKEGRTGSRSSSLCATASAAWPRCCTESVNSLFGSK